MLCICDYDKNRVVTCEKCVFRFELGYKRKTWAGSPKTYCCLLDRLLDDIQKYIFKQVTHFI